MKHVQGLDQCYFKQMLAYIEQTVVNMNALYDSFTKNYMPLMEDGTGVNAYESY